MARDKNRRSTGKHTTRTTYLDEDTLPYPFCPGCGHGTILDSLDEALVKLNLDPHQVVLVTDIGCHGLSDRYFETNAFHGLHGRSVTYATGLKLANPELKIIVLMGDGGVGIGGHHLISAARRNVGITILIFNNFNYGMTGGEHSVTTPPRSITSTTLTGHREQPLDICGTLVANGASFIARTTTFDDRLSDLIADAIQHPGFSLLDIWELCTAYFAPKNRFSKKILEQTLSELNFSTGIIHQEERQEYSHTLNISGREQSDDLAMSPRPLETKFRHNLNREFRCVIAGAAGAKIISAAKIFSQAGVFSGLWATQRNDYPVTVKSGHALAEIILNPQEILYTGISKPDAVIALFLEGLQKALPYIELLTKQDILILSSELPDVNTQAQKLFLDPQDYGSWGKRLEYRAMIAFAVLLQAKGIFPIEALEEAIQLHPPFSKANLAAVKATLN